MTNDIDIKLIGDEELLKVLSELDYKTQHRYLKRVVNDAANIYKKAAKSAIPVRSEKLTATQGPKSKWHPPGTGRKSIMKKMGRNRKNATVFIGPRTGTGDYSTDGWYLKYWEHGTKKMTGRGRITRAYETNKNKVDDYMYKSIRKIIERVLSKLK